METSENSSHFSAENKASMSNLIKLPTSPTNSGKIPRNRWIVQYHGLVQAYNIIKVHDDDSVGVNHGGMFVKLDGPVYSCRQVDLSNHETFKEISERMTGEPWSGKVLVAENLNAWTPHTAGMILVDPNRPCAIQTQELGSGEAGENYGLKRTIDLQNCQIDDLKKQINESVEKGVICRSRQDEDLVRENTCLVRDNRNLKRIAVVATACWAIQFAVSIIYWIL